jgi:lysozyme family protein
MHRFSEIMRTVLKWEGGFVNHPNDPGGATKYGVTHQVLARWRGVASVTPNEVKSLGEVEAVEIFKDKYWKAIKGDLLPKPIDLIMMDGAVNHGVEAMLQIFLDSAAVPSDSKFSDEMLFEFRKTLSDDNRLVDLSVALAEGRKLRYLSRPQAMTFLRGWRNRLESVMAVALEPLHTSWSFKSGRTDGTSNQSVKSSVEPAPVSSIPSSSIDDDDLQAALAHWGAYTGDIDGMFGPKSVAALENVLTRRTADIGSGWETWPLSRKKLALGQLICQEMKIDVGRVDGLFGTRTKAAFENFNRQKNGLPQETWRDEIADTDSHPAPTPVVTKVTIWPLQKDVSSNFGQACAIKMKKLFLPFQMKIAWDLAKTVDGFSIHEKVHDSAARVFDRIYAHYKDDGIEDLGINLFGGCYNCKAMTGGNGKTTSMHAWAIAIDFDPARNQLHWSHKQARLAKPDAVKFWEFWEAEGWLSLGRARDFDWMHVQAARLPS